MPPRKIDLQKIAPPYKIFSKNNCPYSSKFSSKTTTSELRKTIHCLRVLSLKNHSTKNYFSRLQLMCKKWFTSLCFLQIWTKSWRTTLIREHLSLNVSWFPYARTQKDTIFWKNWFEKKCKKIFIANNNNNDNNNNNSRVVSLF